MSRYDYWRPPFSGAFLGGKSIHDTNFFFVILIGLDLLFHMGDFGNLFIFAGNPLKAKTQNPTIFKQNLFHIFILYKISFHIV